MCLESRTITAIRNQSSSKSGKYGDPQNLVQCFLFALVLLEQNDLKIVVRHNGVLIGFLYRNAAAVPMLLQNITYQRFSLLAADLSRADFRCTLRKDCRRNP